MRVMCFVVRGREVGISSWFRGWTFVGQNMIKRVKVAIRFKSGRQLEVYRTTLPRLPDVCSET